MTLESNHITVVRIIHGHTVVSHKHRQYQINRKSLVLLTSLPSSANSNLVVQVISLSFSATPYQVITSGL